MQSGLYRLLRHGWWALKQYPAYEIANLLNESQWWPRQRLEEFRDEKVTRLIEHCYHHVPYYRRLFDELRLKPNDITSASDLSKLPVLSKNTVRAKWGDLRADNIGDKHIFVAATGGSTGEPIRIVKRAKTEAWASMCFERGISWGGLRPETGRIVLTGGSVGISPKSRRQQIANRLSGQIKLLAYDLTEHNVYEYIEVIRRSGVRFIIGYANNIYHLSRMLLERGEKLNLRAVFTTAERLLPSWARTIREAMNCKLYSYYGCGESNSLGYQCQEGDAYHISEEHVVLEAGSEAGKTKSQKSGSLLITDLDNYAMPLVRYENGDYLTLEDQPCNCGRSLRLISKLEGRTYEFLFSTSRELVSAGICDVILGNVAAIAEFQVRQDEFDHIRVLVVACRDLTDQDNAFIQKSFHYYLGESMKVEIELVKEIARTKAQKLQTAINELV
jgi:phenylacetate-coenzyme A ligase PaaK-like adenylate-forming protein